MGSRRRVKACRALADGPLMDSRRAAEPAPPIERTLPGPEPIRRSIRIACGALGLLVLALAMGVRVWIPEAPWWGELPFLAIAAILLVPALLSRPARSEAEWRAAVRRAQLFASLTRAIYLPGLGGMLILQAIRWLWPEFSLAVQPGPLLAALVSALVGVGVMFAAFGHYYRAKAGL